MNLIFYNGIIHTLTGKTAQALAVKNNRIACIGSNEEILALQDKDSKLINMNGNCLVPGFTDTHMHMLLTGENAHKLNLAGVQSMEELIAKGQEYIANNEIGEGEWILGYGFDHNVFDPPVLPGLKEANAISEIYPVVLDRICGHVGAGNKIALELAGFDETTRIPGGALDVDENGKLNGIVREAALDELKKHAPRISEKRAEFLLEEAGRKLAAAGITCVHSDDLCPEGTTWESLKTAYENLEKRGVISVRLYEEWELPRPDDFKNQALKQPWRSFEGTDWLKMGNIKLLGDGSLGSRTANLRESYSDDPGNTGIAVYTQEEMDEMVKLCHDNDFQAACHCIGDGAAYRFVKAVKKAQADNPKNLHHRVVHCQFGDEALYETMGTLGMASDIQPAFVPSDAPLVSSRVGERENTSYAWKSLLEHGVICGGGSDSPVESYSPIWGMHCAINRPAARDADNPECFHPEQKLDVEQALALYTTNPARMMNQSDETGTLEAGKLADLVILDTDIFKTDPDRIKDIQVLMTVANGKITWNAGTLDI